MLAVCCLTPDLWDMMKYASKSSLFALLIVLFATKPLIAGNDAADWIRQMSQAMEELTYQGTFVYLHGGEIETMQVVHDYRSEGVREKLLSLNGEARLIIRDSDNVTCIWPGSKSVIVSKSKPRTPFPQFNTGVNPKFANYYKFMVGGEDRVAGLESVVVAMMPTDQYRYGYKLWVDKKSKLLLRSMLLDSDERVIEQVMFTNVQFPATTSAEHFKTDSLEAGYSWKTVSSSREAAPVSAKDSYVEFTRLPMGFSKISETMRPMPINENPVRHVIVSDGVASVSIYVEYTDGKSTKEMEGASSMGAAHAYGRAMDKAFVTVVGEVPMATVKLIGDAVVMKR